MEANMLLFQAIAALIRMLDWKTVTVVYNNRDDIGVLHTFLSHEETLISVIEYGIGSSDQRRDIFHFLESRIYDKENINVLLLLDGDCLQQFIREINAHEQTQNEQGLFTYLYHWLVVTNQSTLRDIEDRVDNITHFSAISWETQQNNVHTTHVFELSSAAWKPNQRRVFDTIGNFTHGKWKLTQPVFPNEQYRFNGRHFTVVTNLWGPFMHMQEAGDGKEDFEGLCREILNVFSEIFNFTYTIVLPRDGLWGAQDENGTWNGLVKDLKEKVVDFQFAALSILPNREEVMDFSYPFYSEYTGGLYKKLNTDSQIAIYLKPFKLNVWLLILATIPFGALVVFGITRLSPTLPRKESRVEFGLFNNSLLFSFGALFSQGGYFSATTASARFIVGFWWLFCIVIVATYSGNLIAFLTVHKYKAPFETLREMTQGGEYKFGTIGDSAWETILQLKSYLYLWDAIQGFVEGGTPALSIHHSDHMEMVNQGGYVYFADMTTLELVAADDCNLAIMKEKFAPLLYSIGTQNNSVYKDLFTEQMLRILGNGLVDKWKIMHWPRVQGCETQSGAQPMGLEDVQGALLIFSALLLLSCLGLTAENMLHKFCRHNKMTL